MERHANRMRLAALAGAALLSCSPVWPQAPRPAPENSVISIDAQDLSAALRQLGWQAGLDIGFAPETVRGIRSRPVAGTLDPEEALDQLLAGTGLAVRRTPSGALLVERRDDRALVILPELHVTGWRLPQLVSEGSAALQSFDSATLERIAPGTLMDSLSQLPQFINNNTAVGFSDGASGASGASNLNLRGVGPERTLLLLDGRRVVPTTRHGYVDINLLPQALIQRVDIVTGGASAAYGSDAVSGVANIVLDTTLDGARLLAQQGLSARGDHPSTRLSAAYGSRLGAGTHVVVAAEHNRAEGIPDYSGRAWFRSWGTIDNPDPHGPRQLLVPGLNSRNYTAGGLITRGPLAGIQFREGGTPAAFEPGSLVSAINQQGGSGHDEGANLWILPDQRRYSAMLHLTRDVGRRGRLFAQVLRGRSVSEFESHPQAFYTTATATIQRDNAFLPTSVGLLMDEAGVDSFPLARMSSSRDIGAPRVTNDSRMDSLTAGYDAAVGRWTLSAYFQYGHAQQARRYRDIVRLDRIYRAVDSVRDPATGEPVCRSTLLFPDDGCVPIDIFGDGSPSQAARQYVRTSFVADQQVRQHVFDVSLAGKWFRVPAGDASLSTGMALRRESFDVAVLPADLAALRLEDPASNGYGGVPSRDIGGGIFERANYWTPVDGHYRVLEGFVETLVPLWKDSLTHRSLSAAFATRFSEYSGSGNAWVWKVGLDWQAASWLQLRATRSRDMRAGNLAERFDATGAAVRIDFDPANPSGPTYGIVAIQAGNPQVRPEKADTVTAGFEFAPPDHRISLSADYYDIRIHDAITQWGVPGILGQCHEGQAAACGLIRRDADSGRIIDVRDPYINAASARARGIDVSLRHGRSLPSGMRGGTLEVAATLNHILEASTYLPGVPRVERTGQTGRGFAAPDWRAGLSVQYQRGQLRAFLDERFISSGLRDATQAQGVDIDDNSVSAAWYTSLGASWTIRHATGPLEVFVAVNNLFDKDPPRAPTSSAFGTTHTNEDLFDPIGRRFAVGVRFRR